MPPIDQADMFKPPASAVDLDRMNTSSVGAL